MESGILKKDFLILSNMPRTCNIFKQWWNSKIILNIIPIGERTVMDKSIIVNFCDKYEFITEIYSL